ncbi:MAG TPA: aminotransferase class III-fold pyridoxal phosphate-dependent enzyme [Vicinamibacterales bacterium]|nr:aminotransferase class III-fold pyridoxal phosphate-dependent enzyme [Vicinamibacterales bacterium]
MKTASTAGTMSGQDIVDLTRRHTLYEWSAQSAVDPIPVAGAKGCWFWTPEGKRFLDFNSQLMCVNIGHGHERVVRAIQEQVATLAYANPFMATEPRARLGERLAEITPGDIDTFFFTNGGSEATENAIKLARLYTGRHKVMSFYRSYHGATAGSMTLTGDPRRVASEPGIPGVVHVLNPYHGIQRGWDTAEQALAYLDETIQLEGAQTIAAFFIEPVTGTNGVLVPPDGFIQGVRDLCTKHGILMVADEVMSGFGRTGEWFAINHWGVVPDLMTMAKGLTSAYVPLGAVGMRRGIAEHFRDRVFYGGLTYNSHPLGCAAALANLDVYQDEHLIENAKRMGGVMKQLMAELSAKHEIVGATRSLGLFGLVELVKDRKSMEPLAPFNGTSEPMKRLAKFFRDEGLYTFVRWNTFFTNPPLTITEDELRHGFDIIDRGLTATEKH